MDVKKIFIILITIVACIVIGALVLNVILPNGVRGLVGNIEQAMKDGTGISFDLNGDGVVGVSTTANTDNSGKLDSDGVGVKGFQ